MPSLIKLLRKFIGLSFALSNANINIDTSISTNKENFCLAPLCKRAERIAIPKSSRLVDIFYCNNF